MINSIEAITDHCQLSFLCFYAIIHPLSFIVNLRNAMVEEKYATIAIDLDFQP